MLNTQTVRIIALVVFAIFSSSVAICSAASRENDDKVLKKYGLEVVVDAPEEVEPGSQFDLTLSLSIPDGFHIYGSKDKTMPTELTFEPPNGLAVAKAKIPAGVRHAVPGKPTGYWLEGKQLLRSAVSVSDDASGELKLSGELKFMICDKRGCRPPTNLPFEVSLRVRDKESDQQSSAKRFKKPVRIKADGKPISVDSPGYASPWIADINGDGIKDLLVGQYDEGKIKVYPGKGQGTFGVGEWLKADGEVASVPGVW